MCVGVSSLGRGKFCLKECAHTHTHITRSDYLEGLVARQKLGGGSTIQHVSQGPRDKEVEVEADWKV